MKSIFKFIRNFFAAIRQIVIDPEFLELAIITGIVLAAGTIFYHNVEGWRLLDSLYFSVTTLTTIGLGDFAPATDAGKIFTIFYIISGVGILLGLVSTVGRHTREKSTIDKFFERRFK